MHLPNAEKGFEITGATAVLQNQLQQNARLVVEEGRIVEIGPSPVRPRKTAANRLDAGGLWLLPGAVDAHGDGLEQQIHPRPAAYMPLAHAAHAQDRLLAAAGITTAFHALKFSDDPGRERTIEGAKEIATCLEYYDASGESLVEHHTLYRLDVRMAGSWEALEPHLRRAEHPYLSVDDNQPGQGQFRDLDRYADRLRPRLEKLGLTVEEYFESQMKEDPETVENNLQGLRELSQARNVTVASHDDDTPEQVRERRGLGCSISEFPVTKEAALEARELGMPVVLGAPNALRGESTAGNVSARQLLELGAVDALCSDYSPWSLWWTVFQLAAEGWGTLPDLARLVTTGPARTLSLDDRGALKEGSRADFCLVSLHQNVPKVQATFCSGTPVYSVLS